LIPCHPLYRFRAALQRFAAGKGRPERYHETITIALLLLIADRRGDAGETWEEFAARAIRTCCSGRVPR
jgi:hypothetical protein